MAKLPEFKTDEEAAEFFDTHSVADYWDEMEPVEDVTIDIPPARKKAGNYPALLRAAG